MPAGNNQRRLIGIVGATATRKSAAAVELAHALDGEIINADSRQVYRGMDIGTAKPTHAEQATARHWLIDIADPDEPMTLATYLDLAHAALDDVWSRGRQPILVGGTGQYVWALIEGWQVPRVPPDPELRARLAALAERAGVEELIAQLRAIDPASANSIDPRNIRRVIRAIEVTQATSRPFSEWQVKHPPPFAGRTIGLRVDRDTLYARADARVDAMMASGFVDEVRRLNADGYTCDLPPLRSIGYAQICAHLADELPLDAAVARIKTETHRLARMQHTWFRDDDPRIAWIDASAADTAARLMAVASL